MSYLVLLVFFFKNYCSINKRASELILESYIYFMLLYKMVKICCSVGNILIVKLLVEGTKTPSRGVVLKSISKSVLSPKLNYTPPKSDKKHLYSSPHLRGKLFVLLISWHLIVRFKKSPIILEASPHQPLLFTKMFIWKC